METTAKGPENAEILLSQLNTSAQDMAGWLKGFGILNIIIGIPSLVGIVGILYIWLGWLLYQAGKAAGSGQPEKLARMMGKLKTYFTVMVTLTVIGVIGAILFFIAMGGALSSLMSSMPQ